MKYLTLRFPIRYVNHFTWLIQFAEYLPEIKVNNPASNIIPIDVFLEKKKILAMKKYSNMEYGCSFPVSFAIENRQEFYFFSIISIRYIDSNIL